MNVKTGVRRTAVVLLMMCIMVYATSLFVFAGSLDDLSSSQGDTSGSYETGNDASGGDAISDYLHGYTPVTGENMKSASTVASPIVNFLGTVAGGIIMVASAAIFVVTALDLCYIGLPFCRGWLNPEYASGGASQGGGMPMGGMGMGRGMMGGMMGGGMMGAGGAQAGGGMVESGLRRKWVSDEAVFCVNTYAAHAQSAGQQGGMPMGGGMMGGGMMGGMGGMGGMQGGQQQQSMPTKSVIFEYLKKRVFFIIVFSVCAVLLMSSVLMDCGINIAQLVIKVINNINGSIAGVSV